MSAALRAYAERQAAAAAASSNSDDPNAATAELTKIVQAELKKSPDDRAWNMAVNHHPYRQENHYYFPGPFHVARPSA